MKLDWFKLTIVSTLTTLVVLISLPLIIAAVDSGLTATYISHLERAGYYCIPSSAAAGNLVTNNVVPFTDSTYDIGASGNEYAEGYFDAIIAPTGRSATFTIAANDSSTASKAQADYVCNASDDQVEIQAAIDALPTTGGLVLLLEGTFTITDNITLNSYDEVYGVGYYQSIVAAGADNVGFVTASIASAPRLGVQLGSFQYDGNNSTYSGTFAFYGNVRYSIFEYLQIRECGVTAALTIVDNTSTTADNNRIENCDFRINDSEAIYAYGDFVDSKIKGCNFYGNTGDVIKLEGATTSYYPSHINISDCWMDGNGEYGIHAIDAANLRIENNTIAQCGKHGIYLEKNLSMYSLEFQIIGNNFYSNSMDAANTYSSIYANGDNATYVINRSMIISNVFSANSKDKYFVYLGAYTGSSEVMLNNFHTNVGTAAVYNTITSNKIARNIGWVTENSGTATIANGTTVITVTHGLSITPDEEKIRLIPLEDPINSPGAIGVSTNATATQFWIFCENDPGASNLDIGWSYEN